MRRRGPLHQVKKNSPKTTYFSKITVGRVVDTNDPQQMGRLRVACPLLGDSPDTKLENIPWASYVSPFAGTTVNPTRGRADDKTLGQIAYGMFNIPKVGSNVLIMCIDADPRFRVWMGCLQEQFLTHTTPHGRYSYATENQPDGPFSSSEDKIQPLYDSQTQAFTQAGTSRIETTDPAEPRESFEFRTRSADTSTSGLSDNFVNTEDSQVSKLSDDIDEEYTEADGTTHTNTQGYNKSRIDPGLRSDTTPGGTYDPQVYSWTTPGFHSMSMVDNAKNCRVRFRTTHGAQIILDDTNERIYVATAGGKCWIELDESSGNIDMYAEGNLSYHSEKDINFTTEKAFRVKAKEGIHMVSEGEVRLHAKDQMHIKSTNDTNIHVGAVLNLFTNTDIKINTPNNITIQSGKIMNILSEKLTISATQSITELSGGAFLMTGAPIHLNGPNAPAGIPTGDISTKALESYWTSRVPEHEPWGRVMTKETDADGDVNNSHVPDLTYNSKDVGRVERGVTIDRNTLWHR